MLGWGTQSRVKNCHNVNDLRELARERLPKFVYDYLEGGADDEVTMERNRSVFSELYLLQRILVDISGLDTSTEILGEKVSLPIICTSTGANRLYNSDGEMTVAKAADKANIIQILASTAMTSFDDIATATKGPKWCQMYVLKDRGFTKELTAHCHSLGYKAMVLTADCTVAGNRERDIRNQFTLPPKPTPKVVLQLMMRLAWVLEYLRAPAYKFPNFADALSGHDDVDSIVQWFGNQMDITFNWKDAEIMGQEWDGPFVIKGITSVEDAKLAAEIGASGISLSSHGGRQLDHAPSPLEVLEEVVDAVGDKLEVFMDSGFRRGTDVVKALGLGAKACLIGRPYLYGLAAGGEEGVSRTIDIFKSELERDMGLMGLTSIESITRECVRWRK
jgi:L-lactate dehydrogenase (cytochrome)